MSSVLLKAASKTDQVAEYVRGQIDSGTLKPGDCLLSEGRLATELGISLVTVRRGLKLLADEGLIERVQGKGTFVADSMARKAQFLTPKPFNGITLCYPALNEGVRSNVFLGPVIDGMQEELAKAGMSLSMQGCLEGLDISEDVDPEELQAKWGGGIVCVNHRITPEESAVLTNANVPFVQIGAPTAERIPSVHVDHFRGGFMAGLHFIQQGSRKLALIMGNFATQAYCLDIVRGVESAFDAHGMLLNRDLVKEIKEHGSLEEFTNVISDLFSGNNEIDSLLILGDSMVVESIHLLEQVGKKVPEDILLVSYNNFVLVDCHKRPTISAVEQPVVKLGREAVKLILDNKLATANTPHLLLQPKLRVRESSQIS